MDIPRRHWLGAVLGALAKAQDDPFLRSREAMVRDHIEARGIRSRAVLSAMRSVPRHEFVPEPVRPFAYADRPQAIGHGQTISQPYIVAYMTELLDVRKHHRVLEIGAGSGYQAAVLSLLAGHVYTVELLPELAETAAQRLKRLGYTNVTVRAGDGYRGWEEYAPFDRIMVTAAPPALPEELVRQLKPGGRLVAPVGAANQELLIVEKSNSGKVTRRSDIPVMFVPMRPGQ